ncbi:hypothetical protein AB5I41_27450 [Sphingomonas sp. MMS24-JH45]
MSTAAGSCDRAHWMPRWRTRGGEVARRIVVDQHVEAERRVIERAGVRHHGAAAAEGHVAECDGDVEAQRRGEGLVELAADVAHPLGLAGGEEDEDGVLDADHAFTF